jgi:hypothetical protein
MFIFNTLTGDLLYVLLSYIVLLVRQELSLFTFSPLSLAPAFSFPRELVL